MVPALRHIVRYHILIGQHPLDVQIPGSGNQVPLIGVLAGQKIPNQMTSVIQIISIYDIVIFYRMPACGPDISDRAALLRWHQVQSDAGVGDAASAEAVQLAVGFEGLRGKLLLGKIGDIAVYRRAGLPEVCPDVRRAERGCGNLRFRFRPIFRLSGYGDHIRLGLGGYG